MLVFGILFPITLFFLFLAIRNKNKSFFLAWLATQFGIIIIETSLGPELTDEIAALPLI